MMKRFLLGCTIGILGILVSASNCGDAQVSGAAAIKECEALTTEAACKGNTKALDGCYWVAASKKCFSNVIATADLKDQGACKHQGGTWTGDANGGNCVVPTVNPSISLADAKALCNGKSTSESCAAEPLCLWTSSLKPCQVRSYNYCNESAAQATCEISYEEGWFFRGGCLWDAGTQQCTNEDGCFSYNAGGAGKCPTVRGCLWDEGTKQCTSSKQCDLYPANQCPTIRGCVVKVIENGSYCMDASVR